MALSSAWGAAEASFFFLVPDIFLSWVAMTAPRRSLAHLGCTLAAAVLAGLAMFTWSAQGGAARAFVQRVPRVTAPMFDQTDEDLRRHGAWGVAQGPARGIPYKVYAVQAPGQGIGALAFAAVSLPARAWRMALSMGGFAVLGWGLRRLGAARWGTPLHLVFWTVTVALYWLHLG